MKLQEKLLDSTFGRNLLSLLSLRPDNVRYEYEFEAYFQYKIGSYERGYILYFKTKPNKREYKSEIFSKMKEFEGYDLVGYLDYHYTAYKDKKEFIRFLRYELQEILKLKLTRLYRLLLETAFEWVKEQEALLQTPHTNGLPAAANQYQHALHTSQIANGPLPPDQELALSETELKMEEIARSHAGKIVFNNQRHKEKFIQILILLQNLKAPGTKTDLLFQHFTAMDIAAIIRQIEENNDKRTNTLQGYVTKAGHNLDPNDPRVKKLEEALANFFYP